MKVRQRSARAKWHLKTRATLRGKAERPRLSIFRSNREIQAQLIDDHSGRTLLALSTRGTLGTKMARSLELGRRLARQIIQLKIAVIVFDRGGRRFHGRVKAVADGLRQEGIKF